MTLVTRGAT